MAAQKPPPGASTLPDGAMVALATPLDASGGLDEAGLRCLLDRVVTGGVRGVSPVGSTGEGARLRTAQRLRVTRLVRTLVPADMPVVPAVPVTDLASARSELEELGKLGVTAALVAPPAYFPLPDADVLRLYLDLADTSSVPIVIYNIPAFTKIAVAPEVVARLAGHPCVVGIKDSSRDMEYLHQVLYAVPDATDFRVLTGTDTLLVASLVMGAHGTIAASANVAPQLGVAICEAVAGGDLSRARELQQRLSRLVAACRRGAPPTGWKAALAVLGVCGDHLAPPATPLPERLRGELAEDLAALGLLEVAR